MFLSEGVAFSLFWISILILFLSIFILINDSEYDSFFYSKVDISSTISKWVMVIISSIVFVYSLASLFYVDAESESRLVTETLEEKYSIKFEPDILNEVIQDLNISNLDEENLYISQMVEVEGKQIAVIQKGGEFFIVEFKNGLLVEFEN